MSTSEGEDRRGIRVTVDASGHVFLLNDPAEDMCSVEDVPTEGAFGGGGSGGVFVGRGARRAEASGTLPAAEGDDRVGDVATRRMSDPLPPLVALPPALLDAVLSFLDGRSLARAEGACAAVRDASRASITWVHVLRADLGLRIVAMDAADAALYGSGSMLNESMHLSAIAAGGNTYVRCTATEAARSARGAYVYRLRERARAAAVNARHAAAWADHRRGRGPRIGLWRAFHVLHALLGIAAPPVVFLGGIVLLVRRLDGIDGGGDGDGGAAPWPWRSVLAAFSCAPGALLADGFIAALIACVRPASACTRADVCRYAGCDGPWRAWHYDVGDGGDGDSCRKFVFRLFYVAYLAALVALPLLIGAKLDGALPWSWAAVCFPLWVALPLTCCLPMAGVPGMDNDEDDGPVLAIYFMSLMSGVVLIAIVLTTAACIAAKLDGGEYAWHLAFVPIWVFDAIVLCAQLAMMRVMWRRLPPGGRLRSGALLLAAAVGLSAMDAAVLGSPLLVVLKLEGVYLGSWTLAFLPMLVTTAVAAVAGLAGAALFTVSSNPSCAEVVPSERQAVAAQAVPWRAANEVGV